MSEPRASHMSSFTQRSSGRKRGFLARLGKDTTGNVFAMSAAAVIPMIGVVGGAIDASRLYLTRTRLQAACDSGVLAGRKAMTTRNFDGTAPERARAMFDFNYQDADFQTTGTAFEPTADATGKLSATAVTTVPMTLMRMFGFTRNTVKVACAADVQIPNIDIVFVLDVTGSMNDCPDGSDCDGGPGSKIVAMRAAAIRFYETLQTQLVAAGTNAGRVRYGFVPYSQAVNGRQLFVNNPNATEDLGQLPLTSLVNTMTAESRVAHFDPTGANEKYIPDVNEPQVRYDQTYAQTIATSREPYVATNSSGTKISNFDCSHYSSNFAMDVTGGSPTQVTLFPRTSFPGAGEGDQVLYIPDGSTTAQVTRPNSGPGFWELTFSRRSATWEDNSGANTSQYKTCQRRVTRTRFVRQDFRFSHWTYKPLSYDVSSYKNEGGSFQFASKVESSFVAASEGPFTPVQLAASADTGGLTLSTAIWNGCLEERDTVAAATFTPIPTGAKDLNVLTGGVDDTMRWRPVLNQVTYNRRQTAEEDNTSTRGSVGINCPGRSMQNLQVLEQDDFEDYVNSLTAAGATYLDVGMAWGVRLIAPQGIFGARNLTGPNGGQISRHIIFLTDGRLEPQNESYSAYGMEIMSRRITGTTGQTQTTLHARRFQALCDIQRGSVSIWAIGFGTTITGNLTNCADPNRAYQADSATELDSAFAAIARDIADLRLVQ